MSSGSDSDLVQTVAELQFFNYIGLAIAVAVAYDYILTLPKEINYIWNRPWTFVSAMFLVVRYLGLFVAALEGLCTWDYLHTWSLVGMVLYFAMDYGFIIFLAAADIVMILRVYAMYNKSKLVLGLLLVLYAATLVVYTISAIYFHKIDSNLTMTTPEVLDMSFCFPTYNHLSQIGRYKVVPRLTLAGLLVALAIARFGMDAFQAYKETRQWETNRYINLLVREGVLYFLAHLLNNMDFGQNTAGVIANATFLTIMFILSPRFVMSVRQLYVRKMLRITGQCSGIDSGFGFSKDEYSRTNLSSVGFVHSFGASDGDVEMVALERETDPPGY